MSRVLNRIALLCLATGLCAGYSSKEEDCATFATALLQLGQTTNLDMSSTAKLNSHIEAGAELELAANEVVARLEEVTMDKTLAGLQQELVAMSRKLSELGAKLTGVSSTAAELGGRALAAKSNRGTNGGERMAELTTALVDYGFATSKREMDYITYLLSPREGWNRAARLERTAAYVERGQVAKGRQRLVAAIRAVAEEVRERETLGEQLLEASQSWATTRGELGKTIKDYKEIEKAIHLACRAASD